MPIQPILVIEDSDDDFEATERAFKKSGNLANPLFRCEDGQEALDYLLRNGQYAELESTSKPGLILLDLNLPGKDGRSVLAEIKSNEDLKTIPVVVLTTSDDEKDISECYRHGANTYIKKPVNIERFFYAIKQLKEYWFEIAIKPKK
ncbi:response regulator [Aliikangiella coralliicola]|uniref:Response regulator n=2 Tax=Aliikangiella coralliicola TaxID=2592383 RepID=A0A545U9A6_9GAMM|nr:response regulator [Aliikangiella coralliicola]